jgi:predicted DNA-binding WGR domain protein
LLAIPERACYIGSMMTLLSHVDPAENLNRWYLVSMQATLFDPCAVVIAWGRRDNDFQRWRVIPLESMAQANQMAAKIVDRKIKRGYQAYHGQQY